MSQAKFRGALAGGLLLAGLALHWQAPAFFPTLFSLSVRGDVPGAVAYLQSFGGQAKVISFFLLVVINVLGILPNVFLLVANGFVFGLVDGILLSWAGECAGAALGFIALRHLFRDAAQAVLKKTGHEEKIEEFSSQNGFSLILAGRSLPFMPSGVLTAAGALSAISFRKFFWATCLGKAFSVPIEVLSGHDVLPFHEHLPRLIGLGMISLLMIWGYWRYSRRCRENCAKNKASKANDEI